MKHLFLTSEHSETDQLTQRQLERYIKQLSSSLSAESSSIYCTCKLQPESFKALKRSLESVIYPIPVKQPILPSSEHHLVYLKPRVSSFKQFIENILDPNLPYYNSGEMVNTGVCPKHRRALELRQKMKQQARKYSEFVFNSEFESGNLDRVYHISGKKFHLYLTVDTNTKGHTQWFYFAMNNITANTSVYLKIMNFTKNSSLFSKGMRPSVFSLKKHWFFGQEWHKSCRNIKYTKNKSDKFFTLSFEYTFEHEHDTVYFAYSEPYGYSSLCQTLDKFKKSVHRGFEYTQEELCKSLGGLPVPVVRLKTKNNLPLVCISARVHPGETVGSLMAEGLLEFLLGDSREAEIVRKYCEFLVVPMLNPDGVVYGNYRTSLAGFDLNRQWKTSENDLCPIIEHCKRAFKGAVCYIDLHGHSLKEYCFMYGNFIRSHEENYWKNRLIPMVMGSLTKNFSYNSSSFMHHSFNATAARTYVWKEMKVLHSFTLEASFYGYGQKEFSREDYQEVGGKVPIALLAAVYLQDQAISNRDALQGAIKDFLNRIQRRNSPQARRKKAKSCTFRRDPAPHSPEIRVDNVEVAEVAEVAESKEEENDRESRGSDSDPSQDNLDQEEIIEIYKLIRACYSKVKDSSNAPVVRNLGGRKKLPSLRDERIKAKSVLRDTWRIESPIYKSSSTPEGGFSIRKFNFTKPVKKLILYTPKSHFQRL